MEFAVKKDIRCPYCDVWNYINHDDGYGYEENEKYNQECLSCNKTFIYTTMISFDYEVEKAPCLNEESEHLWELEDAYPKYFSNMICKYCGEDRRPTKEERVQFKIPEFPR